MKRIILFSSALIVMMTMSCKKFLDLQPTAASSTESFYKTPSDFQSALDGLYGTVRGLYSTSNMIYLNELTTDNLEIQWSSPTVSETQLDQNAVTPTNAYSSGVWNSCLVQVARCNQLLAQIDNVTFDQTTKNRIKGETLFLRGMAYFYAIQLFGNVPLTTQAFTSPNQIAAANLSLSGPDKVYPFIISDLTSAESLMPATLNTDKTSASIGTVQTMLGKVYLTQHNYTAAATELKKVIDAKQYSLVSDYKSLFAKGNNNKAESILEIEYLSGQSLGNSYSSAFTPAITSMAIFPNNQQGSGRLVPTLDIMNAYQTGDLRRVGSVMDSITVIGGKKIYNRCGVKFVDFTAADVTDGSVAYTVLRYADVLLMYAEAQNENGQTADALTYFNLVHARAGLAPVTTISQSDFRLMMENERRVEFLYESWRWFDLLRTGRTKAVLNAYFATYHLSFSVQDFELLFPIPQSEVDLNPAIKQNPGY